MTKHFMPLFFAFSLLFVATSGRELRNDYTRETTITAKMKQLSDASPSYFGKTNFNDEQGLVAIYNKYTLMLDFNTTGDPCLPTPLAWIECNSDVNPRVIALNLNNRRLSGEIPDFSSMDALQKIDLSENRFTGTIPSFLGSFPHLQDLNLSFNLFNGSVPNSIGINKKVKISYSRYASNISDEPSNFHSISKQVVIPADGPVADAPSDGPMAPQADASAYGPTANEPTSPANVYVTPPAPPPIDDELPPSDVPPIVGVPSSPFVDGPVADAPSVVMPPQADTPTDEPTSPANVSVTPPAPSPHEPPGPNVAAIVGGTTSSFVVLSGIAGFLLYWFGYCCGDSNNCDCALFSCSCFNIHMHDRFPREIPIRIPM